MNAKLPASVNSSRPKVNRPPAFLQPKPRTNSYVKMLVRGLAIAAVLLIAVAVIEKTAHLAKKTETANAPASAESAGMLSPSIGDAQAYSGPGKTFVLQGGSETIVGQMARIPAENEQITELKSVSDIDNDAGRELLSIISKY